MTAASASPAVSEEQLARVAPGVELCFQTIGDPADEPLLLVMGLGGPMNWWDLELCQMLAGAGFFVIRFDNRDIGRSTRMRGRVTVGKLARAFLGVPTTAPYTLSDMADDAFGLLDHLGIDSAHVCGVSMGGMIAQTMAIARPERVRTLTSIMSTTGKRTVGWQHPVLLPTLLTTSRTKEEYIAAGERIWGLIGSPAYPVDPEENRRRGEETYDRGVNPAGVGRQILAILTQPNRCRDLAAVTVPTMVVHGLRDRMVHVSGGRSTSQSIPQSELVLVAGMGHDMPRQLWPTFVRLIRRNADKSHPAPRKVS